MATHVITAEDVTVPLQVARGYRGDGLMATGPEYRTTHQRGKKYYKILALIDFMTHYMALNRSA